MFIKNTMKKITVYICMCFAALLLTDCVSASGGKGSKKLEPNNSRPVRQESRRTSHTRNTVHKRQRRVNLQYYQNFLKILGPLPKVIEQTDVQPKPIRDNETCVDLSKICTEDLPIYKEGSFNISKKSCSEAKEIVETVLRSKGFGCAEFRVYDCSKREEDGIFSETRETTLTSVPYIASLENNCRCYSYLDSEGFKVVKVFTKYWQLLHPNC